MASDSLNVALVTGAEPVFRAWWRPLRWPAPSVLLVVFAGGLAKLAPLVAAVALNALAPATDVAAFYVAFAYAQALSFYCHVGAATTALPALVQAGAVECDASVVAVRVFLAAQRVAVPLLAGFGLLLFALAGFAAERLPLLGVAVVAGYGMAYNQIKTTCLLAARADRAMAWSTVRVSFGAYAPVLLVVAVGAARWAGAALALGYAAPLLWDLVRARGRGADVPAAACLRGGRDVTIASGLNSLVTLLVVHVVETQLAAAAIVAFGVVQQLRTALLFVSVQVGPLILRSVAGGAGARSLGRFSAVVTGATALATLALTLPFLVHERVLGAVFSGRVPLDAAVLVGLGATTIAAVGNCLSRVLEGRQAYRDVLVSFGVFAGACLAVVYAAPAAHLTVQAGFLTGATLQAAYLAWRVTCPRPQGQDH